MIAFRGQQHMASDRPTTLADDLLEGGQAIAEFLWGSAARSKRAYRLAEAGHLPCFRIGARVCARKSTLMQWIKDQENTPHG